MQQLQHQTLSFGDYTLDLTRGSLLRGEEQVRLRPKSFDVLRHLVENSQRLVSKAELMQAVWPHSFVTDDSLVQCLIEVRRALGDDSQRYIKTVPRRGYIFEAEVTNHLSAGRELLYTEEIERVGVVIEEEEEEEPKIASNILLAAQPKASTQRRLSGINLHTAPLVALIVSVLTLGGLAAYAFVIGGAGWSPFFRATSQSTRLPTKVTQFTSFPGEELSPVFSPDGKQIAFAWNGEQGDNFDIYVKLIDTGAPLRLTTHLGTDYGPAFSPDGRSIAFTRSAKGESGIFMVPALGGPERKLLSFNVEAEWYGRNPNVVWSPDARFIAFPYKSSSEHIPSISLLSIETLENSRLTEPPEGYVGDWSPTFSPDGETLAFTRWSSEGATDIYLIATHGGEPRRLTFDNTWINGLDWTSDGKHIVFSSARGGGFNLWRIAHSGGTPEGLAAGRSGVTAYLLSSPISVSRQGAHLAYAQSLDDVNIWRTEIQSSISGRASPTKLITSTRYDSGPQFSPDGKRIVFQSDRSGMDEVWVCDADGSDPRQLSFFGGPMAGTPRWSPDGQKIAFDARAEGNSDIYVVNSEGGKPRRFTRETSGDVVPSWSRDGRWIYFASNRTGNWQVWKASMDGGVPVQVTKRGGFAAFESPAENFIYYAKFDDPGLWRMPIEGGEESLVFDQLPAGYWGYWAVIEEGLYFVNPARKPRATIEFFNIATGRVSQIATLEKEPPKGIAGLAVSPDGRWILYSQLDQRGSDIILVENFR